MTGACTSLGLYGPGDGCDGGVATAHASSALQLQRSSSSGVHAFGDCAWCGYEEPGMALRNCAKDSRQAISSMTWRTPDPIKMCPVLC